MNTDMLAQALSTEIRYPAQLKPVDRGIQGAGFYPGTQGYTSKFFPAEGIMLLGRDFGTVEYYLKREGKKDETALTWRHTRDLYLPALADVPVWCTNYLMGLRVDGSARGNIKLQIEPTDWKNFEADCWNFFIKQFDLQKPRVLAVFGEDNASDLRCESRLQSSTFKACRILYLDHPHSAIGSKNQTRHIDQAARIRRAWLDQQSMP